MTLRYPLSSLLRVPSYEGVGPGLSDCKRIGKMQKVGCLQIVETKKNQNTKHQLNTKEKKASRKLSDVQHLVVNDVNPRHFDPIGTVPCRRH